MIPPMSTVASGVRAVMNLATGPAGGTVTGRYFDGMTEARAHEGAYDPVTRSRLRAVTAELLAPFLAGAAAWRSRPARLPDISRLARVVTYW